MRRPASTPRPPAGGPGASGAATAGATARLQPTLVMLDCDGTLFDSYAANVAYYDEVLLRLSLPPLDASQRDLAHRMAGPQLFDRLFGHDPSLLERALGVARSVDYAPFLYRLEPVPRLRETLAWLRERFKTALVTNRGSTIPALVAHFDLAGFFDLTVGIHDVERPKPAPDMLLLCLDRFAVGPSEAVYVGDSSSDLEASHAAGVEFIAVGPMVARVAAERRLTGFAELTRLLA